MQLRQTLMVVVGVIAGALAAYGEFVLDIRAPRSSLMESHGIGVNVSIPLGDYQLAMKKKYGPDTETVLKTHPLRAITSVGGKVVEDDRSFGNFSNATGVFVVGPHGHVESTFPFLLDPRKPPASGDTAAPGVGYFKGRFGQNFPAKYLEYNDRDVARDKCVEISPADLGWLGEKLRFQSGTFCVMSWSGASPGSMLIGVALAEGDPWMRPFGRRICRWLTSVALARVAATDHTPQPGYAACVLADRPGRSGADEILKAHVYEVRGDATLAYVN